MHCIQRLLIFHANEKTFCIPCSTYHLWQNLGRAHYQSQRWTKQYRRPWWVIKTDLHDIPPVLSLLHPFRFVNHQQFSFLFHSQAQKLNLELYTSKPLLKVCTTNENLFEWVAMTQDFISFLHKWHQGCIPLGWFKELKKTRENIGLPFLQCFCFCVS